MLSEYLRSVDTIDVSVMKRSCKPETRFVQKTSKPEASKVELELDKFMGALTAMDSPDAVTKTITAAKRANAAARSLDRSLGLGCVLEFGSSGDGGGPVVPGVQSSQVSSRPRSSWGS